MSSGKLHQAKDTVDYISREIVSTLLLLIKFYKGSYYTSYERKDTFSLHVYWFDLSQQTTHLHVMEFLVIKKHVTRL